MEYHGQAELYRNGRHYGSDIKTGRKVGLPLGDFYFIAVEKEPPYGVSVNKAARDFLTAGRDLNDKTLEDFAYWKQMGAPDVGYEWRKPLLYSTLNAPYWAK